MLRRAVGSARHFRARSIRTGAVPVQIKQSNDEIFYRGRIKSFFNNCKIAGRPFKSDDDLIRQVAQKYKIGKNGKQPQLAVYSRGPRGNRDT